MIHQDNFSKEIKDLVVSQRCMNPMTAIVYFPTAETRNGIAA